MYLTTQDLKEFTLTELERLQRQLKYADLITSGVERICMKAEINGEVKMLEKVNNYLR